MDWVAHSTAAGGAGVCPVDHAPGLAPETLLYLDEPRRMVVQQRVTATGAAELALYYGDREISFDEPHLFAFAQTLAVQSRFRAGDALGWGPGYGWAEIAPLLADLVTAGILSRTPPADDDSVSRERPSPLPAARTDRAYQWTADCAHLTQMLAGRPVDPFWLELIVPVFRVAHIVTDADGRQVGEANVFPRALRRDIPTSWMSCPFPGTRYNAERPMNTTALKAMRTHWAQMMAALTVIRAAFLARYPDAARGWTIAHVERLATLVLAVATYPCVRPDADPAPLHPALASLFRVTDGLRMATHQMMFVPVGEPALPPHTPVDAQAILDYAERNYSFHSETGVCAGPSHMVLAFIETLLHGTPEGGAPATGFAFDPAVAAALADIAPAFDYGLRGLRSHAALFSFWPAMARAYEAIAEVADDAVAAGHRNFVPLATRFGAHLQTIRRVTLLGTEVWRQGREAAYAEIFDLCGNGLGVSGPGLMARLAAIPTDGARLATTLSAALAPRLGASPYTSALAQILAGFGVATQRLLAVATAAQAELSLALGRAPASTPFSAADIAVHAELLGQVPQRLPFLFDEIAAALGVGLDVDPAGVRLAAHPHPPSAANSGR